jgi:hypothetical protein
MFISAVAKVAHVKSGMRVQVIPGQRIFTTVTMKFKPVIVELMPMRKIAIHLQIGARHGKDPEADHVEPRKGNVARADLERHHEIAEGAGDQRNDDHPHHGGAVQGVDAVVGVVVHDRARGHEQLDTHEFGEQPRDREEEKPDREVLDSDDLVVDREDVLADEAFGRRMDMVVRAVLFVVVVVVKGRGGHFFQAPT